MRRGLLGRTGRAARIGAIVGVAVSMVALGTGTAGAAALPAPPGSTGPALVKDPAGLVNTFIGTGSGGAVVGDVDLFPGAAVPFGMLTFSPQTPSEPDGGGYYYGDSSIDGFALTHISGPGCSAYGDFPILPTVGAIGTDPNATTDPFSHSHESATPGAYSVTLSPGTAEAISTRLSATTRTGIASFQFPATSKANLIFKVGQNQMETSAADVHVIGNDEVTGSVTSGHFCGDPGTFSVHFVATFNRPFRSYGTFDGTKVSASSTAPQGPPSPPSPGAPGAPGAPAVVASASGTSSGAYVSFDTASPGQRSVKMKVAISYVSTANAMLNLRAGDPGWSVGSVAAAAHREWNQLLSRVDVGGGTHSEQVQFYTALYHALLDPSVFSDVNGQYIGFDNKVHQLPPGQVQYANYSGWDIYRSEVPLLAMMAPRRTSQMITSLLNDATQGGWLPKWPFANDYTGEMDGDPADSIIADAYAFGARDFNTQTALAYMIKGATDIPSSLSQLGQGTYVERPGLSSYEKLGYVSGEHASLTLEYATADDSIAQFADALGDTSVYKTFLARSENWENVYDSAATYRGYSGYFEPRAANGEFPTGPAFSTSGGFGENGFREGNATQYAWMVPQDLNGLFTAMGGDSTVIKRLDTFFTHLNVGPNEPYYWAGNEPGLEVPWEYDYAGDPGGTQAIVHRIVTSVYSDTPGGEPGNDDLGAMSSWLVWAYLGMYPETPGTQVLALGAPIFPEVDMHLANGHVVNLSAPGATTNSYVEGLTVNGKASTNDWLDSSLVTGPATTSTRPGQPGPGAPGQPGPGAPGQPGPGAPGQPGPGAPGQNQVTDLAFTMGSSPSTTWGVTQAEEPPSYQAKPLSLPSGAYLSVSPDPGGVAPGQSSTETLELDNSQGTAAVSASWKATASGDLVLTPASGTLSAAVGEDATVSVRVTAPAGASEGFDNVTFSATTSDGSALPPDVVPVAVAPPTSILRSYNSIGIADALNASCANFDGLQGGYSESQLSAAGLPPGATVTVDGARLTWPDVPVCEPDNIQADGQTVPVQGSAGARSLVVLGAGGNGNASGTVTLHYTDGSTATASLGFSDWALDGNSESPGYGDKIVAHTSYRYESGSSQDLELYVFAATIPLDPGKTLASVTLPAASAVSGAPSTSMHVFALGESDLFTTPSQIAVAPGGSASFDLGIVNPGGSAESVTWKAGSSSSGVTLSPSGGTVSIGANTATEIPVTVGATSSAAQAADTISLSVSSGSSSLGSTTETVVVANPGNLGPFDNNVGITSASDVSAGNFDGDGNSYEASLLAAAGLAPGATFHADGATLTWPDVAVGSPDNIAADGQTILAPRMPAGAESLVVVGSASNGPSHGGLTLTYANGTSQTVQLGFTDWTLNGGSASGESFSNSVVASLAARNCSSCSGSQSVGTYLFAAAVPVAAGETLERITLPSSTDNGGMIHVFAVAGSTSAAPVVPVITSLSPSTASAGVAVTIEGSGFGSTQGSAFVHFADNGVNWGEPGNTASFTVEKWSDTSITFKVPTPSDGFSVVAGSTATVTVHGSDGEVSDPVSLDIAS